MTSTSALRPYRPADRAALFDICVRTGHEGGDAHLGMVTANTPARAFCDRLGFHEIPVPDPGTLTYLGLRLA